MSGSLVNWNQDHSRGRMLIYLDLHVRSSRAVPRCLPSDVDPPAAAPGWRSLHAVEHSFLYHEQQASRRHQHEKRQHGREDGRAAADRARARGVAKVHDRARPRSAAPLRDVVMPPRNHGVGRRVDSKASILPFIRMSKVFFFLSEEREKLLPSWHP